MSKFVQHVGKLIFLALFGYFAYKVHHALDKLIQKKIGSTVSTAVSETRLFPSLSICFVRKNVSLQTILSNIDESLKNTRNETLISFVHHGLQENGRTLRVNKDSPDISMHYGWRTWQCVSYDPPGPAYAGYDGAIIMELNGSYIEPREGIYIYAYKAGSGIVPRGSNIYGSALEKVRLEQNGDLSMHFNIKRREVKALDQQIRRCDEHEKDPLSKCISGYLDDKLNCSTRSLESNKTLATCDTDSDLNKIYEVTKDLIFYPESKIFQLTRCMPSCSKSELELMNIHKKWEGSGAAITFLFVMAEEEYDIREEYYIYDENSFIADVGGFLGLLLGQSILGLYFMLTEWAAVKKLSRTMVMNRKKAQEQLEKV